MWTLSAWCPFLLCSDVWQHWAWFVGHWVAVDDSPKFTSHVTSCGPPSFVFIQMYLFWLLFILLSLESWSLSVCYIICDYHWFSSIAVVGWYANVSKFRYQTFLGVRLLMLASLLPHFCVTCHLVDWYSLCPFHSMMVVSVVVCTKCTSSSVALTCVHC